ncbi:hypothetical protein BDR07DRAFT_1376587 [Suillus spraguei]|nr:hypothetical protein BDR07DRAFT_1376587 [Suillus spraguei]
MINVLPAAAETPREIVQQGTLQKTKAVLVMIVTYGDLRRSLSSARLESRSELTDPRLAIAEEWVLWPVKGLPSAICALSKAAISSAGAGATWGCAIDGYVTDGYTCTGLRAWSMAELSEELELELDVLVPCVDGGVAFDASQIQGQNMIQKRNFYWWFLRVPPDSVAQSYPIQDLSLSLVKVARRRAKSRVRNGDFAATLSRNFSFQLDLSKKLKRDPGSFESVQSFIMRYCMKIKSSLNLT